MLGSPSAAPLPPFGAHLVWAVIPLALGLWATPAALAQTSAESPAAVSFPNARRNADGRVRRAWGLGVAAPGPEPLAARRFLAENADRLALGGAERLAYLRSVHAHGTTYVRFVDTRFGGAVLGSSVVVGLRDGQVVMVSLGRAALPSDGVRRTTSVEALAVAARATPGGRLLSRQRAGYVLADRVVPVEVFDFAGAQRHQRERVVVDARNGELLGREPRLLHARGRVYASDPVTDEEMTTDVELLHLTSRTRLTGRYFRVASCDAEADGCQGTAFATPDEEGDFLYAPAEPAFDDGFAEVNAYHHADRVAAYFRETHGFTWQCAANELMNVTVNYTQAPGVPYDNAGYSPTIGRECGSMIFGQGTVDFAYDGDVIYHEFGHAVVDQTAELMPFVVEELGVSYAPGAINEAVADYVAATLSDDPRMAAYFGSQPGAGEGALRRLDNTLTCPEGLVGEVHFDGRLFAGLLWDVREAIGSELADALMFATLAALDASTSLSDAAEVLAMVAASFETEGRLSEAERAEVDTLIEARGLIGCERIVPLDDGVSHLAYSGLSTFTGSAGARIAPVQFRIDIPADTEWVRFRVRRVSEGGTYRLHVGNGAAPRVTGARVIANRVLELDDLNSALIERGPDLTRCETLHVAVETVDLASIGAAFFEIDAQLERTGEMEGCEEPEPDASVEDAAMSDAGDAGIDTVGLVPGGGCQCGVAPRSSPPTLLLWLGLGLAVCRLRTKLIG